MSFSLLVYIDFLARNSLREAIERSADKLMSSYASLYRSVRNKFRKPMLRNEFRVTAQIKRSDQL